MASAEEIIGDVTKAFEVGAPLVTKIIGLIADAAAAPGERHDAIVAQLQAAEAALEEGAVEQRKAADGEYSETQALINRLKKEHADELAVVKAHNAELARKLADGAVKAASDR